MQAQVISFGMRRVGKFACCNAAWWATARSQICPPRGAEITRLMPTLRSLFLAIGIALAFSARADAYLAFVSNEKGNTVSVIDTAKLQVVKTIKVGQRPRGIGITKDGTYILVCVGDDDAIEMIDAATHEIVGTLPSGPDPEQFAFDPEGKILYVANEDNNMVTVIDLER